MNRIDRRLAIVLELQEKRWQRAADLAATFGVSARTIYRDMDVLEEAGIPVVAVPGKGYSLYEGYFLPPLTLTSDEAVLLLLGTEYMAERLGVNYQAAARAVRAKVEAILPDRLRSEVTTLQNSLRFVPVNAFDNPAEQRALQHLRRAMTEQRAVRFHYHQQAGDNGMARHTVNPYGLVHFGGAWHLVGYCRARQSVRHFRLSRVEALEMLDETFERPQGYTLPPTEAAHHRDLVVRVRFDAEVARWVQEAPSAYTVDTEVLPDGLLVTLKVQRETEVLPWLLSWGAHAQVLEPLSLRHRLAREAEQMAARYRPEPMLLS
ncbi:MAG: helix-turn-helix transcriptional regulator [Rhodothermales bacterium]